MAEPVVSLRGLLELIQFGVRPVGWTLTFPTPQPYTEFMTATFIESLKAEIAEIEAALRADPRHRKLAKLRETLAEYEPLPPAEKTQPPSFRLPGPPPDSFAQAVGNGLARTKEERIKAELTGLFTKDGPQHRSIILEHLKQKALMGHEKDPMASLAAYLSGWKDVFGFDGKGTWGLRDQFEYEGE
jgi:hypothetical protein